MITWEMIRWAAVTWAAVFVLLTLQTAKHKREMRKQQDDCERRGRDMR